MLRNKALLIMCLLLASAARAQDPARGWQWQNPLPQGNSINSIRFAPDKKHGWAVGANGVVLMTDNGGFEWQEQVSPANTTLYGLYIKDKSRVVITGARGVVLTTNNAGKMGVASERRSRSSVCRHVCAEEPVARLGCRHVRLDHLDH